MTKVVFPCLHQQGDPQRHRSGVGLRAWWSRRRLSPARRSPPPGWTAVSWACRWNSAGRGLCRVSTSSPCATSPPTNSGSPPGPPAARSPCGAPAPLEDTERRVKCKYSPTDKRDCLVKRTDVMSRLWAKWAESWWTGRTPTGSPSAFPPPPPCWRLPPARWTRRAGCWSGRSARRGCRRCLCRYSPLLRWGRREETCKRDDGWGRVLPLIFTGSGMWWCYRI